MRNSFIYKVTRVHKVLTVANSINLCSTILVVFLESILSNQARTLDCAIMAHFFPDCVITHHCDYDDHDDVDDDDDHNYH